MAEKRGSGYILGILSIVLAFFLPLAAIVLGIIGLVLNKKEKSKKAKILNIVGIIIGIIFLIINLAITYLSIQNFPVY
jgi:hypothetical protein